ncbi:MAG: GNAT family N-acetyltransferase [Ruminococcaceae bacterium]|nr:GNAT family N-acetyltransferase [Oscillospiraceae bacterium]
MAHLQKRRSYLQVKLKIINRAAYAARICYWYNTLIMETVFESERIRFVKATLDLVPDYLEMVNDIERVAKYISDRREPYTLEEETDYIKDKIDNNAMIFSMIEKSTGKFIGNTEFFNFNYKEAEWGIVITASMQNKGYGKEALLRMIEYGFNEAGLDRIYLEVYRDNARACHVYEACGFTEYKRTEKDIFMDIQKDR